MPEMFVVTLLVPVNLKALGNNSLRLPNNLNMLNKIEKDKTAVDLSFANSYLHIAALDSFPIVDLSKRNSLIFGYASNNFTTLT